MINSINQVPSQKLLFTSNNSQSGSGKTENVSGKDSFSKSNSLSKPGIQILSIGTGIAGLIALIRSGKINRSIENNLDNCLQTLGVSAAPIKEQPKRLFQRIKTFFSNFMTNEKTNTKLDKIINFATKDGLTELLNRKSFNAAMDRAFEKAKHEGKNFSAAILDIDYFKSFNDVLSHQDGDTVLKEIGSILNKASEKYKNQVKAFRYGGEEFSIIFEGMNQDEANKILKEITESVKTNETIQGLKGRFLSNLEEKIKGAKPEELDQLLKWQKHVQEKGRFTSSAGLLDFRKFDEIIDVKNPKKTFFDIKDKALYHAKETGRDSIVIADEGFIQKYFQDLKK